MYDVTKLSILFSMLILFCPLLRSHRANIEVSAQVDLFYMIL